MRDKASGNGKIPTTPQVVILAGVIGIIHAEDLHRAHDGDVAPGLVQAPDIAMKSSLAVAPDDNLLEALRDFGFRDVETLTVVTQSEHRIG